MRIIEGSVTAPKGFRAGTFAAAIKPTRTTDDCALIVSERPASAAGVFTTNVMKAAPVLWDMGVCQGGIASAVFCNAGNANACTGEQGDRDVRAMADQLGERLEIPATEALVCSTGVIGVPLPMARIAAGIEGCAEALSETGGAAASRAIMTTDTRPKAIAVEVELSEGAIRIGGIAKGAGMIAPNMATLLCFITTDAAIQPALLQDALREAVEASFNRICIDNDMSTNDTVLMLANGLANAPKLEAGTSDYTIFANALGHVCRELAKDLVRDGEGVTKVVEIEIIGAEHDSDARAAAFAIATSHLCKTAFHGEDPNWGRIACAVGYSGASFQPENLSIWIGGIQIMSEGGAADFHEPDVAKVMKEPEFTIRVEMGGGPGSAFMWTSDLSEEYVGINADYRS